MIRGWRVLISAEGRPYTSMIGILGMSVMTAEKLYCVNCSTYIQHNGVDELPEQLSTYVASHNGEYPPFMHLPSEAVKFRMKYFGSVPWPGNGPLPDVVLKYVNENGFLPRYMPAQGIDFGDEDLSDDGDDDAWDKDDDEDLDGWMD